MAAVPHSFQLRHRLDSMEHPVRRTGGAAQLNFRADEPYLRGRHRLPRGTFVAVQKVVNKVDRLAAVSVVVVVPSPQTPEDDPEKRLRTQREACKYIDGRPKVQPRVIRVKGGATEP